MILKQEKKWLLTSCMTGKNYTLQMNRLFMQDLLQQGI